MLELRHVHRSRSIRVKQRVDRLESKASLAGQCRGVELGTVIGVGPGKSYAAFLARPWIGAGNG